MIGLRFVRALTPSRECRMIGFFLGFDFPFLDDRSPDPSLRSAPAARASSLGDFGRLLALRAKRVGL
jgi:hypothetical protein